MEKVKLAICMGDLEYRERFLRCMMNHYRNQYEVYVYTEMQEIKNNLDKKHQVLILEDVSRGEISDFINSGEKILFLQEDCKNTSDETMPTNLVYAEKYQEVFKIADEIQKLTGVIEQKSSNREQEDGYSVVGIFSLSNPQLQLPFAGTLASIFGERNKCMLIDQQAFSGLGLLEKSSWGMEDMMAVATTGVYTKGRIVEGIVHQENWDYFLPVKNAECLAEGSLGIYKNMMDILAREQGYKIFVVNFGSVYSEMFKLMEYCHQFFYLMQKEGGETWREQAFFQALKEDGREDLLKKITRIQLPMLLTREESWENLMQQWRWNEIGNGLRNMTWMEK